jgi:hypothetical protein
MVNSETLKLKSHVHDIGEDYRPKVVGTSS